MREALRALDCLVVIDVAMTETAKLADYVLPSATQYEKAEATFFNFEFPENAFHLRPRLFEPLEGTLPEAEIHARLCEALGAYDEDDLAPLREAAERGALGPALFGLMANPGLARLAPVLLYRSLGETLPAELKEGAVVYGLALRRALESGASLARAGLEGGGPQAAEALFAALLEHPSGVVFAKDRWEDQKPPKGRFVLALPDMLEALAGLDPEEGRLEGFPFVLSAGERRSFTANTIIRDPAWRRKDPDGALRISPQDASALGVQDGGRVRLTTPRGSAEVPVEVNPSMQPGHLSLPNGLGTAYPDGAKGVSPNELTSLDARDPFVGTPWHKAVPARLEALRP
jgi:anaerobic selenocysteine-containing dehydrogenase